MADQMPQALVEASAVEVEAGTRAEQDPAESSSEPPRRVMNRTGCRTPQSWQGSQIVPRKWDDTSTMMCIRQWKDCQGNLARVDTILDLLKTPLNSFVLDIGNSRSLIHIPRAITFDH